MKKKIWSLLLAGVMAASLFSGCGKGYEPKLPTEQVEAEVFVAPIEGLAEDFIKGMDVSSVIAEEESGVKYYNEAGEEEDLFQILADSGINYIRVRVWNHPYDEDGNGYGGGNNDVKKAAEIGKRAAKYGMKLLVDFHYSDFWADPNKQYTPVEWRRIEVEEKQQLLKDFTVESLNTIIDAGADVGMVQIGNEINNGMSGEYEVEDIMALLTSASEAVRSVSEDKKRDIRIAVHYTEIDDAEGTMKHAQDLQDAQVDYDIFGVSYYPYWHGTMENMKTVLTDIRETYGKKTCILETSYPFTNEDGDAFGNSVSEGDLLEEYPASVQGQASCIRDIMAAASEAQAMGVFYWEGAWVPVGTDHDSNQKLWEEHGSGWASSYAAAYDAQDAGLYYGGCSWDNQAMFDFSGKALPSLSVFKYVNYGARADLQVMVYPDTSVEIGIGEELIMPETVEVIYNDPSVTEGMPVTWDAKQLAAVDTNTAGTYSVEGTTEDKTAITANIKVVNINYIQNPGFDEADTSMWQVSYFGEEGQTDIQTKAADALSGENAFHFYSTSEIGFTLEQKITDLKAGDYSAVVNIQGGDMGNDAKIYLYVSVDGQLYTGEDITLEGWVQWVSSAIKDIPVSDGSEVVVGISVFGAAKGWGTIDDFEFYCQQ